MHRVTARLLLIFALLGNLAPLAVGGTTSAAHACCVRKAVHPCHGASAAESENQTIRNVECCGGDAGGALTAVRWAHAAGLSEVGSAAISGAYLAGDTQARLDTAGSEFQSVRAPPHSFSS